MVVALKDLDVQIYSPFHSFIQKLFLKHLPQADTGLSIGDKIVKCANVVPALKLFIV